MADLNLSEAWALGVPLIMALVWLIRLEGRVNTQTALLDAVRADLSYIRSRIDKAVNGK